MRMWVGRSLGAGITGICQPSATCTGTQTGFCKEHHIFLTAGSSPTQKSGVLLLLPGQWHIFYIFWQLATHQLWPSSLSALYFRQGATDRTPTANITTPTVYCEGRDINLPSYKCLVFLETFLFLGLSLVNAGFAAMSLPKCLSSLLH